MSILALEASTAHGSVAVLAGDGMIVFEENFVADRTHSFALFSALERARAATASWERIVVGLGPGSYAGVRIAISAALGLQLTSGAQLYGLPSIVAMDVDLPRYAAIGDARRDTFYWSLVERGLCLEGPELITAEQLTAKLAACEVPILSSETVTLATQAGIAYPSAVWLARWVLAGIPSSTAGDLEPIYLREPHITRPKAAS